MPAPLVACDRSWYSYHMPFRRVCPVEVSAFVHISFSAKPHLSVHLSGPFRNLTGGHRTVPTSRLCSHWGVAGSQSQCSSGAPRHHGYWSLLHGIARARARERGLFCHSVHTVRTVLSARSGDHRDQRVETKLAASASSRWLQGTDPDCCTSGPERLDDCWMCCTTVGLKRSVCGRTDGQSGPSKTALQDLTRPVEHVVNELQVRDVVRLKQTHGCPCAVHVHLSNPCPRPRPRSCSETSLSPTVGGDRNPPDRASWAPQWRPTASS